MIQGLGLIGCGRFARFVLGSLAVLPEVELRALASRSEEGLAAAWRAWASARRAAAGTEPPRTYQDWRRLLADPAVSVVLVTTPPHLHAPITRAALEAGKHVLVEKPGALDPRALEEADALARQRNLAAAPNFVMRWNPLWRLLAAAARTGLLGRLERAAVENHAHGDLPPDHWFWDPARSGGIFVEHGVHFFDLLTWLAGAPRTVRATALPNPAGAALAPDRVLAAVIHGDPAGEDGESLVTYYHAFTRPAGLAATRVDLACDRGEVRVRGWTAHELDATLYLTGEEAALLRDLVASALPPGAEVRLETEEEFPPHRRTFVSRRRPFRADRRVRLRASLGDPEAVYAECVRAGFRALLRRAGAPAGAAPAPPEPAAAPTLADAARALRLAVAARTAAETGTVVTLPDGG